jgi:hypothetical protein
MCSSSLISISQKEKGGVEGLWSSTTAEQPVKTCVQGSFVKHVQQQQQY